ncbi:MAG: hypothetical protein ACK4Z9_07140, partial [Thermodesulfovibrionales bacterium]
MSYVKASERQNIVNWCCSIILLLLTGCGYTIHGRSGLPFPSVSIDRINNMTYEPRIDDRMREILTE